ncbi:MAG: CPBP family intramembrane glutamic endopeptidase [Chitinophagales bacterium]
MLPMISLPPKTKPSIIAAGIILSVLLYILVSLVRTKFLAPPGATEVSTANSYFISRLVLWFYLLLIYVYVLKVERQKFLLWSEKKSSLLFYLISIVSILAGITVIAGLLHQVESYYGWDNSSKLKTMLQLLWKNKLLLLFTTLSAGIMEELLFRGYLMPRLQLFLKKTWLVIFISSLLFALAHYSYGSWSQIINPFFIGLIFAWHYQKYRNIKVLMICHFLIDFISILTTH